MIRERNLPGGIKRRLSGKTHCGSMSGSANRIGNDRCGENAVPSVTIYGEAGGGRMPKPCDVGREVAKHQNDELTLMRVGPMDILPRRRALGSGVYNKVP